MELSGLAAESVRTGVQVSWQTGFEADNLGYRVFREVNGAKVLVNNALIAGSALSFRTAHLQAGYSYAWKDAQGAPGDRYWLESVDLSGRHAWHGPVTAEGGTRSTKLMANSATITALRPAAGAVADVQRAVRPVGSRLSPTTRPDFDRQTQLAAGQAAKIVVREDGWYRVTFQDLTKAGFPVDAADAATLQLYTNGLEQAIEVTTDGDGVAPSAIEFYGTAADTPYTDGRVYWLVKGEGSALRVRTITSPIFRVPSLMSFPYTVEHKERSFYVMGIINGDAQNFFGRFIGADGVDQTLIADHVDAKGGKAFVEVTAQGLGGKNVVEVSLNGSVLGTLGMEPWQEGSAKLSVPDGVLLEGQNTLRLRSLEDNRFCLFDTVRLTYPRWSEADGDALLMGLSDREARDLRIQGFSQPTVRVMDISSAARPVELAGSVTLKDTGYAVAVHTPAAPRLGGVRTLYAFSADQIKHPAAIIANRPSHWRTDVAGADVVMITTHDLEPALAPLVALRRSQGHSVAVVDIQDIYDEYSYGLKAAAAIRDFLGDAAQRWQTAPKYVVLVGNGTYDPRDYLGLGGDLVPTMHVNTAEMEAPSDDWFADLDGDGSADLAIGRLPVETFQQASDVVAKLVQYEDSGSTFARALLVADAAIGSNFQAHQLPSASGPAVEGDGRRGKHRGDRDPGGAYAALRRAEGGR